MNNITILKGLPLLFCLSFFAFFTSAARQAHRPSLAFNVRPEAGVPQRHALKAQGAADTPSAIHIDELYMANSKDGEAATTFSPTDHTIYCIIELNRIAKDTRVKFSWIAVDVEGEEKNFKFLDVKYRTKALENVVKAHATLPRDWPTGHYKVEVYINGLLDRSSSYSIK